MVSTMAVRSGASIELKMVVQKEQLKAASMAEKKVA